MLETITKTRLQDPENPDWTALNDYLWEQTFDYHTGTSHFVVRDSVRLSEEDWEAIKNIIEKKSIPVTLCNTCFGFSVGMTLWTERNESFPGSIDEPRPIVTIAAKHLPDYKGGKSFEMGWEQFSQFTHSKRNIQILKRNQLPEPGAKSSYSY